MWSFFVPLPSCYLKFVSFKSLQVSSEWLSNNCPEVRSRYLWLQISCKDCLQHSQRQVNFSTRCPLCRSNEVFFFFLHFCSNWERNTEDQQSGKAELWDQLFVQNKTACKEPVLLMWLKVTFSKLLGKLNRLLFSRWNKQRGKKERNRK